MKLNDLKMLLDDHQTGMSDFQDDYLVTVRAGGTIYGQYKQALRELYKRFRGLRELIYGDNGQKMLDLEIEELQIMHDDSEGIEKKKLFIKLSYKIIIREESERVINDTYREFMRFYQQANILKKEIGELTAKKRRELEIELWIYRIKEMAAIDYLQNGRISQRTIEFSGCLPKSVRSEIYNLIFNKENYEKLIDEYINREEIYAVPFENMELLEFSIDEIDELELLSIKFVNGAE